MALPMPAFQLIEKSSPLGGEIAHRQLLDSIPSLVENCRAFVKRNHMNRQFAPASADRINQIVALCLASPVRN
jgi:chemotaxis response regulator CheB